MRILIVTSPTVDLRRPFAGGTETFVVTLANTLSAFGHDIDVYARSSDEADNFQLLETSQSDQNLQDDLHDNDWGQKYFEALQLGLMDFQRYDLIHLNSYMPLVYDLLSKKKVRQVITLHAPPDERLIALHSLHSRRCPNAKYIAVSERLLQQWSPHISSDIDLIHNGIDIATWAPRDTVAREKFCWAGRITPQKNLVDAIEFSNLCNKQLLIAGPVSDHKYFDREIEPRLNDRINYIGHVHPDKLRKIFHQSEAILATATWIEPFGLCVLEAQAAGCNVIGYDSAVSPELRASGVTITKSKQCAKALFKEYQNYGHKLSSEKAVRHAQRFSHARMAKGYRDTFKEALPNTYCRENRVC